MENSILRNGNAKFICISIYYHQKNLKLDQNRNFNACNSFMNKNESVYCRNILLNLSKTFLWFVHEQHFVCMDEIPTTIM